MTPQNEMAASLRRDGFGPDEIAAMIAPGATPGETVAPVQLRWGPNDVMYGDDDTTTVMLSDANGRPYWLELEPERAAVLRVDLAGPEGEEPTNDRAALLEEVAAALEAQTCTCGCRRGADFIRHLAETLRTTGALPSPEETPVHT